MLMRAENRRLCPASHVAKVAVKANRQAAAEERRDCQLLGRVEAEKDAVLGRALDFGDGHPRRKKLPMAGSARFGTGSPGSGGP
jgi:hypothetical protein